jgi:hypothetical protein
MFKTQKRRAASAARRFFSTAYHCRAVIAVDLLDQLELIDNPETVGGNIFFKRLKR